MDDYLTVDEAAAVLKVSAWVVRRLVREGKLGCYKPSERWTLISRRHIAEFLEPTELEAS